MVDRFCFAVCVRQPRVSVCKRVVAGLSWFEIRNVWRYSSAGKTNDPQMGLKVSLDICIVCNRISEFRTKQSEAICQQESILISALTQPFGIFMREARLVTFVPSALRVIRRCCLPA